MGPVVPGLIRGLRRGTRVARKSTRSATDDELEVYKEAKKRAAKKRIAFHLTRADFDILVTRADGKCEETGVQFNNCKAAGQRYRPDRLSIDRLSPKGPYSLENCRLVRAIVNMTRNDSSLMAMHVLKLQYFIRQGGIPPSHLVLKIGKEIGDWEF